MGKNISSNPKTSVCSISDVETQEYIYDSICEKLILKYDSAQLGIDDVTTEQEFVDE